MKVPPPIQDLPETSYCVPALRGIEPWGATARVVAGNNVVEHLGMGILPGQDQLAPSIDTGPGTGGVCTYQDGVNETHGFFSGFDTLLVDEREDGSPNGC